MEIYSNMYVIVYTVVDIIYASFYYQSCQEYGNMACQSRVCLFGPGIVLGSF